MLSPEALDCAETIFAYCHLRHKPRACDVLIVLGTNDTRVADFAADLYSRGLATRVVVTGGVAHQNDLLATTWGRPEAEVFAEILSRQGVRGLELETKATNTAENISFSKRLIGNPPPASVLYACKPFMPRRVYATHAVEWPEVPATVASWDSTFAAYCNEELPPEKILNIMLGDVQRLWIYAERGYSAPQRIPEEVMQAFHRLVELGFTRHLIR